MAMTASGRRGGPMAAINVTPMADIMIVLLIIFMVVTPLIANGPVKRLPRAANAALRKADADKIVIAVTSEADTFLSGRRLDTRAELLAELQSRFAERSEPGRVVFIEADERVPYSEVRDVMALCREAGAEEVALVARQRLGS
jgi:biopolymer transport protein TolR